MTTPFTVNPAWVHSPIVQRAVRRAGQGADAIDVLETLHEMILTLEEKAPGVPFIEIFETARQQQKLTDERVWWEHAGQGTKRAAAALGAAYADATGCEARHVDVLLGGRRNWATGTKAARQVERREQILELRRSGMTVRRIADTIGVSKSAVSKCVRRWAPELIDGDDQ